MKIAFHDLYTSRYPLFNIGFFAFIFAVWAIVLYIHRYFILTRSQRSQQRMTASDAKAKRTSHQSAEQADGEYEDRYLAEMSEQAEERTAYSLTSVG